MLAIDEKNAAEVALTVKNKVASTRSVADTHAALTKPFPVDAVSFKPMGRLTDPAKKVAVAAYVDARTVMHRLDSALGANNWKSEFSFPRPEIVHCRITFRYPGTDEWLYREDVGEESDQPDQGTRLKAACSDALKRCAVHLGIGRYLYELGSLYAPHNGKHLTANPRLPQWAIPLFAPEPVVADADDTGPKVVKATEAKTPDATVERVSPQQASELLEAVGRCPEEVATKAKKVFGPDMRLVPMAQFAAVMQRFHDRAHAQTSAK